MSFDGSSSFRMKQSSNISLHDLQQWMRWIIVDPRGVKDALQNPHPNNPTHPDRYIEPKCSGYEYLQHKNHLNVDTGLNIYAEGYFSRLLESLAVDFAITKKILGEELFAKMVVDYLKNYPSYYTNITDVGKSLSKFVRGYKLTNHIKYIHSLVDIEWLFVESFHANNMPDLNLNLLLNLPDDAWDSAQLIFDPAFRLCRYNWPVHELLHHFDDASLKDVLNKMKCRCVFLYLYRIDGIVRVQEISSEEFEMLSFLNAGNTLGALVERVNENNETNLSELFAQWTDCGLIREIKFHTQ